jgi:Restriction endonuclease
MSKAKKHFSHGALGTQSTVSKGRMIEAIVASMHEGEGVKVERNVKLPPIGSQAPKREIDVLLSAEICGYPVRWAFECKNEKKRIGVLYIDAFVGKLQDVGIPPQFGIFVTTSDYSKGAIEQAKNMVAHVVKAEKLAKLRATFLLFGYYSFCICPADTS